MGEFAKLFIGVGVVLITIGILILLLQKLPGGANLGRLPGDIYIRKGNLSFYFPLATSILVSLILTFIVSLLGKK